MKPSKNIRRSTFFVFPLFIQPHPFRALICVPYRGLIHCTFKLLFIKMAKRGNKRIRTRIHTLEGKKQKKKKIQGNKKKLLFYFFFHGFFFFLQADNKSSLTPALIAMRYVDTVMWQKLKWKKKEYVKILHVHEVRLFGGASVRHLKKEMQLGISR